jgi:hypothetical protein
MTPIRISLQIKSFVSGIRAFFNAYKKRVIAAGGYIEGEQCAIDKFSTNNLLKQASWLLIPEGIKEDVVYAQKPTDGLGDLTFTRASDATRTNSAGEIERTPWNLVTFSEQFDNAAWTTFTQGAGVAPARTANYSIAPDGTMSADRLQCDIVALGLPNRSAIIQNVSVVNATIYTFSMYVKSNTGANQAFTVQNSAMNANVGYNIQGTATSEWQRFVFVGTSAFTGTNGIRIGLIDSVVATSNDISIWGAQLVEGTDAKPYFATTNRQDVPRLDYRNADGSVSTCPRLLLEPQRTNSVLQSSSFVTSPWFNSGTLLGTSTTLTANSATAPDGTNTATLVAMTRPTTSGATYVSQIQSIAAGVYASSIYLRAKDATHVGKVISAWQWDGAERNMIDITLTNSWVRYSLLTSYSHTTGSRELLAFGFRNGRGSTTSVEFYAWGGQGELGAYATTFIPTTTAAVTRLAEGTSKAGVSSLIGQTEGTIYWEGFLGANAQTVFSVRASNAQNSCVIDIVGNNRINAYVATNNVVRFSLNSDVVTLGANIKIAFAYKSGESVLYVNGVSVTSSTAFTFAEGLQALFADWNGYNYGNPQAGTKAINQAALFPTRLTNAQILELTTL